MLPGAQQKQKSLGTRRTKALNRGLTSRARDGAIKALIRVAPEGEIIVKQIQEQSELSQSESDDQTTLRSRHSCKASRRERLGDYREGARPYVRAHAILCRAMWENHASHWLCLPVRTKGLGAPCLEEREEVCLGEEAFPTLQQGAPHMPHLEAYPPMRHAT